MHGTAPRRPGLLRGCAGLLLLGASLAAQEDSPGWHVRGHRPDGAERSLSLAAPTASFRLAEGEAYHPAFQPGDELSFAGRVRINRASWELGTAAEDMRRYPTGGIDPRFAAAEMHAR